MDSRLRGNDESVRAGPDAGMTNSKDGGTMYESDDVWGA